MERKLRSWRVSKPSTGDEDKKDATPAPPARKLFMKMDRLRGPIRGTVYDGWFQIDSYQWGSGVGISSARRPKPKKAKKPAPAAAGEGETVAEDEKKPEEPEEEKKRTCSSPSYSELTLTKAGDGFSAYFIHGLPVHQAFDRVTIEVVNIDGYLTNRWGMREVLVSGFSSSYEVGGGSGSESISLNFEAMEMYSASWKRRPLTRPENLSQVSKETSEAQKNSIFGSEKVLQGILKHLSSSERLTFALSCKTVFLAASADSFGEAVINSVKVNMSKEDELEVNGVARVPDPQYRRKGDDDYY